MKSRKVDVCYNCIIEPICSTPCYKSLTIVENGMKIVNWIFTDPSWDPKKEFGMTKEELSKYYWEIEKGLNIKFEDLKKLKGKRIEVAQIVHGRLYLDKISAVVLPNKKLAVNTNKLG